MTKKETTQPKMEGLPVWDTGALYASLTDTNIQSDLDTAEIAATEIETLYKYADFTDLTVLAAVMPKYEYVIETLSKAGSFAYMLYSVDKNSPLIAKEKSAIEKRSVDIATKLEFVKLKLSQLTPEIMVKVQETHELAKYVYYLQRAIAYKPHMLSEETEIFASQKSLSSNTAWINLYDDSLAKITIDSVVDANKKVSCGATHLMSNAFPL